MNKTQLLKYITTEKNRLETEFKTGKDAIHAEYERVKRENGGTIPETERLRIAEQHKRVNEKEAAGVRSLCEIIQKETGIKDVLKRNTDAVNNTLQGGQWAEYMLRDVN